MPGGSWPLTSSASRVAAGPCSTIFSSRRPGRPDDPLRPLDIGDSRQLDENLIAAALLRDARLGDAELVDAPLDRLARLHDRLVAQRHLDVRLHRERVGAVRAGAAVEVGLDFGRHLPEGGVLGRRDAFDDEADRIGSRDVPDGDAARHQLRAQPLHLLLGRQPQRIVGLHAQDEVHAALQVEPELELTVDQEAQAG